WLPPAAADDVMLTWAFLRTPVAVVTALVVALAYLLLRRLYDEPTALLAGLFWACDPFLIAHSSILHVDGLLTALMVLSILAALVAFFSREVRDTGPGATDPAVPRAATAGEQQPVIWPFLFLSAVAGGLALLTKSPSVLLLPTVAMLAVLAFRGEGWRIRRGVLWPLLLWGAVAAAVWLIGWPAVWVDLPGAVARVVNQVRFEGAEPHGWGNFFLGRAVEDPGPLFYLVVLLFRLPPWTLLGVAVLVWLLARRRVTVTLPTLVLLGFVVVFVVLLTLLPKKFDRYILPVFPVCSILAAVGWISVRPGVANRARGWRGTVTAAAVVVGLVVNVALYYPYQISYYSPLFGGGAVAARVLPVGWGEGHAEAGAYINAQVNGCDRPIALWFDPVLDPFVCAPVVRLPESLKPGRVDYAVLYIDQLQRTNDPQETAHIRTAGTLVHTVTLHGIPYAEVYQLPQPTAQQVGARFGESIRLYGYTLDAAALRTSGVLTFTTVWQALAPPAEYMMVAQLLDDNGALVAQIDVPPGGPANPTSIWYTGHYVTWYHPLPVPADLPAGTYRLAVGLYDPATFARLPIESPPGSVVQEGALLLPLAIE
ncbi:MAG: phospholipid carrier-dependent glycosyltransferase, partial [Blastochloris sp.]|nr:phospholipid carrier-dependent glycosyltransferase [Blastochloris sp.]